MLKTFCRFAALVILVFCFFVFRKGRKIGAENKEEQSEVGAQAGLVSEKKIMGFNRGRIRQNG